jgi:hypothetical protein
MTEDSIPDNVDVAVASSDGEGKKKSKKRDGSKKSKRSSSSKGETKKSGVRTKFLLESLRQDYYSLQDENTKLREIIMARLPNAANAIIAECCPPRKKVSSIDELGEMMPNMTIEEGDEDEEDEEDEEEG